MCLRITRISVLFGPIYVPGVFQVNFGRRREERRLGGGSLKQSSHATALSLGPLEMKDSPVFTDKYPPAVTQNVQTSFLDVLWISRSAARGDANFVFPVRNLGSRTTKVATSWWVGMRIRCWQHIHGIAFDAGTGRKVTLIWATTRCGLPKPWVKVLAVALCCCCTRPARHQPCLTG